MACQEFQGTIVVYSIIACPYCMKAKNLLNEHNLPFEEIRFDLYPQLRDVVTQKSGMKTVPQIYFNEVFIGGSVELQNLVSYMYQT